MKSRVSIHFPIKRFYKIQFCAHLKFFKPELCIFEVESDHIIKICIFLKKRMNLFVLDSFRRWVLGKSIGYTVFKHNNVISSWKQIIIRHCTWIERLPETSSILTTKINIVFSDYNSYDCPNYHCRLLPYIYLTTFVQNTVKEFQ